MVFILFPFFSILAPKIEILEVFAKIQLKARKSQAPSTRIRLLLNPQLFVSGFKNVPVHTKRIQIEFPCPHACDGIRIHSRDPSAAFLFNAC